MSTTARHGFCYTPLFCEENIWHLCNELIREGHAEHDLCVLFISNTCRQVAMLNQRSADPGSPVIWDYHVVLLERKHNTNLIYDFDSRLPFPLPAVDYLQQSFPDQQRLIKQYRAQFRRIPASQYLQRFYSDRSHMIGVIEPQQFPDYPPIRSSKNRLTFQSLLNMQTTSSKLYSLDELLQ